MEYCVGVSTETVLQMVTFYTLKKITLKLTFRTIVLRRSECQKKPFTRTKDYSPKRQFSNSFHHGVKRNHL